MLVLRAAESGNDEAELKALIPDGLPEEIKEAYENAHA